MEITQEEVGSFQKAWRQEFGEEIDVEEARRQIHQLDALYLILSRSNAKDQSRDFWGSAN